MKVFYDKVAEPPFHALDKQEAHIVFAELRDLIRKELRQIRFTNKRNVSEGDNAYEQNLFLSVDHLKIASRGLTKEECIHQIVCFCLRWSSYPWLDQSLLNTHPAPDREVLSNKEIANEARERVAQILRQLESTCK